ncbi:hypothetical protein [Vasconcelosia minhoensis]|uniref:hypothetical protein n=1 Tax=Vasconcelosia minhoensis TaxID=3366354 RepID=UPI001D14775B|nr:hypothetical protein [Romeria gracilis]
MAKRKGIRKQLSQLSATGQTLEKQVNSLIEQKKFSQAIRKLQQGLKRDPNQQLAVSEANIWQQQGEYELEQTRYPQAESSFRRAIGLGLRGDSDYGLAKTLLAQQKQAAALEGMQAAFEDKTLPKDLGGCYLKLLFLNHQADLVKQLVKAQAKRFQAAHLHWARGALALESGDPKSALSHFKKMGQPVSPDDHLMVWEAYARQRAGDWSQAEKDLEMTQPSSSSPFSSLFGGSLRPKRHKHPAEARLTMLQATHTERSLSDFVDLDDPELPERDAAWALAILQLVRAENFHDAAHLALDLPEQTLAQYPELKALYRPLMLLAGDQARQQGELDCTALFLADVVNEPEFDPKVALHLYKALELTEAHHQAEQQLEQLLAWVQQAAKQDPAAWPESRLSSTLAKLHCLIADNQVVAGRDREARRSVRKAEQLAPKHPDVIGRKGLEAVASGEAKAAVPLLTQALEAGCRFPEVYSVLLEALAADPDTAKAVRRKFGKHFGDLGIETEVEVPAWVEALTFQNYTVMEQFVSEEKRATPALEALKIFLDSAADRPSSSQKVALNQVQAVPQWEELLRSHPPVEQVEIIKAIYLVLQQHARRNQKGMVALQANYLDKIAQLSSQQVPGADIAYLMILALRTTPQDQLEPVAAQILSRARQPATTLAQAQLELCRFGPNRTLMPLIEAQLKQEPQHPQLLLAKANLYPRNSEEYQTFYDQGFEIARRLQDAAALQAFREEDWFKAQAMAGRVMGAQMGKLNDPSQIDVIDMLTRMAREAFGVDMPPEVIAQMIPELEAQMDSDFLDDDEDEFEPIFLPLPPRRGKSSKKRKSWYQL